jgi:hypothetical protein
VRCLLLVVWAVVCTVQSASAVDAKTSPQNACRARVGDSGDRIPLESIPGIRINAEDKFSELPQMLLHYTFEDEEGSVVRDRSGNGNDARIYNAASYSTGLGGEGSALSIIGTESTFGSNGGHALLPFIDFEALDSFSISLWVSEQELGLDASEAYIAFGRQGAGARSVDIHHGTSGSDYVGFRVGTNKITTPFLPSYRGQFVHYGLTYSNGVMSAYCSGELVGSTATTVEVDTENAALGRHWWDWNGERTSTRLTASYDEVRIYDCCLSSGDIAALYNGIYESGVPLLVDGDPEALGVPAPQGYGSAAYSVGSVVTNSVTNVVSIGDGVQWRCTGWTGTGSVPTNGTSNVCSFVISEASVLTWLWALEYRLDVAVTGRGVLDGSGRWFPEGDRVCVTAFAYPDWMFQEWLGVAGAQRARHRAVELVMDAPRSIHAFFCDDSDRDGLPDWWEIAHFRSLSRCRCMDTDRDGLRNVAEWLRGTNPVSRDTDGDHVMDGVEVRMGRDPLVAEPAADPATRGGRYLPHKAEIKWDSESGHCYCVERSTNLVAGFEIIATNVPATPPVNVFADDEAGEGASRFYRIVEGEALSEAPSVDEAPRTQRRDLGVRLRLVAEDL